MLEHHTNRATLFQKNGNNDMYGYVYLTYDTIRKMVYIGKHKSPVYDYKYLGSGNRIIRIKKKRPQTLLNIPLQWATNKEQLDNYEINWIRFFRESFGYDRCYNIANGGDGGRGYKLNKNDRKRLGESLKGHVVTEETRKKLSVINKGKHLTEETKKKIGEKSKLNHANPEIKKRISEGLKKYYSVLENRKKLSIINKGRKKTDEHKQKIRESNIGKHNNKKVINILTKQVFHSIRDCAKYYNVDKHTIVRWIQKNKNGLRYEISTTL